MSKKEAFEEAMKRLAEVSLQALFINKYSHELSGGQKQRVVVTRALITESEFIILDEPKSMLDVSTQVQMLELLKDVKVEKNLTYLFITHNLAVA
uniref:ABC transporter ATP-binding protein n=1 Tax=Ignisphaera aggregans TaxID=334771 RepID=A0A7J3QFQ8_9CREN